MKVICFFWVITKLISFNAWIAERSLPTVAIIRFLDIIPAFIHLSLYIVALLCFTVFIIKGWYRMLAVALIVEFCSCLLDLLRWQPYEYLYIFIAFFYLIFKDRPQHFFIILRILLSSTYIFSGLHKIGGAFLYSTWDKQFLLKFGGIGKHGLVLHYSGLLLPLAELGAGIALLLYKNRRWPALALIFMHICILLVLGPFGLNSNYIIWGWNICLIVVLYILNYHVINKPVILKEFPKIAAILLLVFWLILPASNLFGYWIHYFSSGMYSGKTPNVYICLEKSGKTKIVSSYFSGDNECQKCTSGCQIRLNRWAEAETGLMPFTELFYYERLKERIGSKYPDWQLQMFYTIYPYKEVKEIK
ncbi:DoxX family protein [Flavobacterium psychrotrophum]|uniref:DoxX family protein n=1 Tax=Flavobacterium psychrotrophum TaxID=2294119 RepID=UPI0013C4683E|nr:DoxX family protein [Flavobacterium psychrotrophum]